MVERWLEHAEMVIDRGMQGDTCNDEWVTPLNLGAKHGHDRLFCLLICRSANINAVTHHTKETPLIYTVSAGSIDFGD